MKYLRVKDIRDLHNAIIESHELQGEAADKSIESVISRIDNRLHYGFIEDVYHLAACYACHIAVGHAFNEANKRTAFAAMDTCLALNNIELEYPLNKAGEMIIEAVNHRINDKAFAEWLRSLD